ncbi:MAG: hypothetical protein EAZ92_09365 [Candidatus Kapaibacterium sp.]|nr:MAG: hypothetical protein EAZ92_09365 [Candidatus Kapabacteria bacterium]
MRTCCSFTVLLLLCFLLSLPLAAAHWTTYHHRHAHPIHASVTALDYNATTKSFELSCKIFADDLETVLKQSSGVQVMLGSAKEVKNINEILEQYFRKHLAFRADGKPLVAWKFLGKELEGEAVWCYIEIPISNVLNTIPKQLHIQNSVLMELYDDQTNLVNAQIGSVRRSTLLRKNKQQEVFEF